MPITDKHPQYSAKIVYVNWTRPCIQGQLEVKKAREFFLPGFVPTQKERYNVYLERAIYTNYTGSSHTGFHGMVFRVDPVIDLPERIEYLKKNTDGAGTGLKQFSKKVVSEVLAAGNFGLLVDPPQKVPGVEPKAKIATYLVENIHNWTMTVDQEDNLKLTMVTLYELATEKVDLWTTRDKPQYRVLLLTPDNGYIQQIYDEFGVLQKEIIVSGPDGEKLTEIPFYFVGAENNLPGIDKPPLYDISVVNIGHYRNSADKEENEHLHGQGTLIFWGDISTTEFKEANPDGINVGARKGHFLGMNGGAELLQLESSQALEISMEKKENRMVAIGARFIRNQSGNETIEQTRSNKSDKSSSLETLVGNCEEAIKKAIDAVLYFAGMKETEYTFSLNRDFYDKDVTPQEVAAEMLLLDNNIVAKSDVREAIRGSKYLSEDRTDEEIDNEIIEQE